MTKENRQVLTISCSMALQTNLSRSKMRDICDKELKTVIRKHMGKHLIADDVLDIRVNCITEEDWHRLERIQENLAGMDYMKSNPALRGNEVAKLLDQVQRNTAVIVQCWNRFTKWIHKAESPKEMLERSEKAASLISAFLDNVEMEDLAKGLGGNRCGTSWIDSGDA
jgi:hypothetical protein